MENNFTLSNDRKSITSAYPPQLGSLKFNNDEKLGNKYFFYDEHYVYIVQPDKEEPSYNKIEFIVPKNNIITIELDPRPSVSSF